MGSSERIQLASVIEDADLTVGEKIELLRAAGHELGGKEELEKYADDYEALAEYADGKYSEGWIIFPGDSDDTDMIDALVWMGDSPLHADVPRSHELGDMLVFVIENSA